MKKNTKRNSQPRQCGCELFSLPSLLYVWFSLHLLLCVVFAKTQPPESALVSSIDFVLADGSILPFQPAFNGSVLNYNVTTLPPLAQSAAVTLVVQLHVFSDSVGADVQFNVSVVNPISGFRDLIFASANSNESSEVNSTQFNLLSVLSEGNEIQFLATNVDFDNNFINYTFTFPPISSLPVEYAAILPSNFPNCPTFSSGSVALPATLSQTATCISSSSGSNYMVECEHTASTMLIRFFSDTQCRSLQPQFDAVYKIGECNSYGARSFGSGQGEAFTVLSCAADATLPILSGTAAYHAYSLGSQCSGTGNIAYEGWVMVDQCLLPAYGSGTGSYMYTCNSGEVIYKQFNDSNCLQSSPTISIYSMNSCLPPPTHTLDPTFPSQPPVDIQFVACDFAAYHYIGCYADPAYGSDNLHGLPIMADSPLAGYSINECAAWSATSGYQYFAIQNGNECFASQAVNVSLFQSRNSCNASCTEPTTSMCGGFWANAVYELLGVVADASPIEYSWVYIGCYEDNQTARVYPYTPSGTTFTEYTATECAQFAAFNNFKYFALQSGGLCFAGDANPATLTVSDGCISPCKSNENYCGSVGVNSIFQLDSLTSLLPIPYRPARTVTVQTFSDNSCFPLGDSAAVESVDCLTFPSNTSRQVVCLADGSGVQLIWFNGSNCDPVTPVISQYTQVALFDQCIATPQGYLSYLACDNPPSVFSPVAGTVVLREFSTSVCSNASFVADQFFLVNECYAAGNGGSFSYSCNSPITATEVVFKTYSDTLCNRFLNATNYPLNQCALSPALALVPPAQLEAPYMQFLSCTPNITAELLDSGLGGVVHAHYENGCGSGLVYEFDSIPTNVCHESQIELCIKGQHFTQVFGDAKCTQALSDPILVEQVGECANQSVSYSQAIACIPDSGPAAPTLSQPTFPGVLTEYYSTADCSGPPYTTILNPTNECVYNGQPRDFARYSCAGDRVETYFYTDSSCSQNVSPTGASFVGQCIATGNSSYQLVSCTPVLYSTANNVTLQTFSGDSSCSFNPNENPQSQSASCTYLQSGLTGYWREVLCLKDGSGVQTNWYNSNNYCGSSPLAPYSQQLKFGECVNTPLGFTTYYGCDTQPPSFTPYPGLAGLRLFVSGQSSTTCQNSTFAEQLTLPLNECTTSGSLSYAITCNDSRMIFNLYSDAKCFSKPTVSEYSQHQCVIPPAPLAHLVAAEIGTTRMELLYCHNESWAYYSVHNQSNCLDTADQINGITVGVCSTLNGVQWLMVTCSSTNNGPVQVNWYNDSTCNTAAVGTSSYVINQCYAGNALQDSSVPEFQFLSCGVMPPPPTPQPGMVVYGAYTTTSCAASAAVNYFVQPVGECSRVNSFDAISFYELTCKNGDVIITVFEDGLCQTALSNASLPLNRCETTQPGAVQQQFHAYQTLQFFSCTPPLPPPAVGAPGELVVGFYSESSCSAGSWFGEAIQVTNVCVVQEGESLIYLCVNGVAMVNNYYDSFCQNFRAQTAAPFNQCATQPGQTGYTQVIACTPNGTSTVPPPPIATPPLYEGLVVNGFYTDSSCSNASLLSEFIVRSQLCIQTSPPQVSSQMYTCLGDTYYVEQYDTAGCNGTSTNQDMPPVPVGQCLPTGSNPPYAKLIACTNATAPPPTIPPTSDCTNINWSGYCANCLPQIIQISNGNFSSVHAVTSSCRVLSAEDAQFFDVLATCSINCLNSEVLLAPLPLNSTVEVLSSTSLICNVSTGWQAVYTTTVSSPFSFGCVSSSSVNSSSTPTLTNPYVPENQSYPIIRDTPPQLLSALVTFRLVDLSVQYFLNQTLHQNLVNLITRIILLASDASPSRISVTITPDANFQPASQPFHTNTFSQRFSVLSAVAAVASNGSSASSTIGATVSVNILSPASANGDRLNPNTTEPTTGEVVFAIQQQVQDPNSLLRQNKAVGPSVDSGSFNAIFFGVLTNLLSTLSIGAIIGVFFGIFFCFASFGAYSYYSFPRANNLQIILFLLSIYNFASKIYFLYWLQKWGAFYDDDYINNCFIAAIVFIIARWTGNAVAQSVIVHGERSTNDKYAQWLKSHACAILAILPFVFLEMDNILILNSNLFHRQQFSAPTSAKFIYLLKLSLIGVQLTAAVAVQIIAILVAAHVSSLQGTALFVLLGNGLMLAASVGLAIRAVYLGPVGIQRRVEVAARRATLRHWPCAGKKVCGRVWCIMPESVRLALEQQAIELAERNRAKTHMPKSMEMETPAGIVPDDTAPARGFRLASVKADEGGIPGSLRLSARGMGHRPQLHSLQISKVLQDKDQDDDDKSTAQQLANDLHGDSGSGGGSPPSGEGQGEGQHRVHSAPSTGRRLSKQRPQSSRNSLAAPIPGSLLQAPSAQPQNGEEGKAYASAEPKENSEQHSGSTMQVQPKKTALVELRFSTDSTVRQDWSPRILISPANANESVPVATTLTSSSSSSSSSADTSSADSPTAAATADSFQPTPSANTSSDSLQHR